MTRVFGNNAPEHTIISFLSVERTKKTESAVEMWKRVGYSTRDKPERAVFSPLCQLDSLLSKPIPVQKSCMEMSLSSFFFAICHF